MTFVDFRHALHECWKDRDAWDLIGTIMYAEDQIKHEYHQFASDTTEHTIPAGTYPVIRYYSKSSHGYEIGVPMLAQKSIWRSGATEIVRKDPEIYWPHWYVFQVAEMAEKGTVQLAPGWQVKSQVVACKFSNSGFDTRRWFEHDGQRVSFSGV